MLLAAQAALDEKGPRRRRLHPVGLDDVGRAWARLPRRWPMLPVEPERLRNVRSSTPFAACTASSSLAASSSATAPAPSSRGFTSRAMQGSSASSRCCWRTACGACASRRSAPTDTTWGGSPPRSRPASAQGRCVSTAARIRRWLRRASRSGTATCCASTCSWSTGTASGSRGAWLTTSSSSSWPRSSSSRRVPRRGQGAPRVARLGGGAPLHQRRRQDQPRPRLGSAS